MHNRNLGNVGRWVCAQASSETGGCGGDRAGINGRSVVKAWLRPRSMKGLLRRVSGRCARWRLAESQPML
eukprot:2019531-Pleurochrysis_carterae.AAC.1